MIKIIAWFITNIIICILFFVLAVNVPFKKEAEKVVAKLSFRGCEYRKALVECDEYRKTVKVSDGFYHKYNTGDMVECLLVKEYTLFGGYKGYNFILEDNPKE